MSILRARIDEATARRTIEGRKFRRLRRLLGFPLRAAIGLYDTFRIDSASARPSRRPLPHLECVWLPCYRITFDVTRDDVPSTVAMLVGGHTGQCTVFDPKDLQTAPGESEATFPPALDPEQATRCARDTLTTLAMRSPNWTVRRSVGQALDVQLLHYPYWVYYYERRRDRLDIKVLDAVTGKISGPKIKDALFTAFLNADRQTQPAPWPHTLENP